MSSQQQEKLVIAIGKRKTAIARAIIRSGGIVRVNGAPVELIPIEIARLKVMEPLLLLGEKVRNSVDIDIRVSGGGYMFQAEACRMTIARGLAMFFSDVKEIKEIFKEYDRTMLSGDPRRTKPEKWMRYSTRRFRQKSYR